MARADDLVALLSRHESLLVCCHDNPDPDSIMSAVALERIATEAGVETTTLAYAGTVSHQQNRALVTLLDLPLEPLADHAIDDYDLLALVDHSTPGENNRLPTDTQVDIVVDHHPAEDVDATFVDHRESVGAAATILVEYLHDLGIVPDADLATGLLFAIRRETLDFTRGATANEYIAAEFLHPHVYLPLLKQLLNTPYSPATVDALGEAITNRRVRADRLVSRIETTEERDALPQAADFLLNLEGVSTVVVFGVIRNELQLSARSADPDQHIGALLRETFDGLGSVGGHREMAGGRIPLDALVDAEDREQAVDVATRLVTSALFGERRSHVQ
ncbi:bifunctional oligoribonuclease/PAP phosphatase NrnA [Halomarina salina]|uniref:Bifunctional oligoribonuclease/PAP phosphatase NrnA n=1 Tax=Halomarina salina TaxID=1872699 RepID=A0ABD5RN69_9EURY|nr:bifunctional oligoribonuclease/PAP phosphatase NrnA [Halomarina salina]